MFVYEPHLLCQNNAIRVFALVGLTVCLAFTEYAAADVSFSTRTGATGTFHTVTFQTLHLANYDGISLGQDIHFPR